MRETILDIRERLANHSYANESAISQGVGLRILHSLAWPTYDTTTVWPEFSLQGTRVDFALCHPPQKPLVLIEVKQLSFGSGAEHQLFGYAVHHGVPLAILTTGQEWHFFLPGERGDYGERRVYMLDLLERDPDECVSRLRRYLDYQSVCSGQAIQAARAVYRDFTREREIKRTLPEAWSKLIREGDELLLELVAEKVESLCGYKPSQHMVVTFLAATESVPPSGFNVKSPPTLRRQSPRPVLAPPDQWKSRSDRPSFVFQGNFHRVKSKRDVMVGILRLMAEQDPTFPERMAEQTKSNKARTHIARSRIDLFPRSPDLADEPAHSRELVPGSGWWVDVHMDERSMEKVIKLACEVAGLAYGVDVQAHFD